MEIGKRLQEACIPTLTLLRQGGIGIKTAKKRLTHDLEKTLSLLRDEQVISDYHVVTRSVGKSLWGMAIIWHGGMPQLAAMEFTLEGDVKSTLQ